MLKCSDFRRFLKKALILRNKKKGKWGLYSGFSRSATFSSRSFIRDVVEGKKQLGQASVVKIGRALKLNRDLRQYFELLVELDSFQRHGGESLRVEKQLKRTKSLIEKKIESNEHPDRIESLLFSPQHMVVFAALGDDQGATLEEICQRTNLKSAEIEKILTSLVEKGAAEMRGPDRFGAKNPLMIYGDMGPHEGFRKLYIHGLRSLIGALEEPDSVFNRKDTLFFHSYISVLSKDMPRFRTEFREFLLRFMDTSEHPLGDHIAQITVGFV